MITSTVNCDAVRREFPQYADLTDAEIAELVEFSIALIHAVIADVKRRAADAQVGEEKHSGS